MCAVDGLFVKSTREYGEAVTHGSQTSGTGSGYAVQKIGLCDYDHLGGG
jgi:hypothetical protein